MRSLTFGRRNVKEILRDPLSYIFCLGFPLVMLVVFTIVSGSIPSEANVEIFKLQSMAPSMAVFGLTFIMLFNCIQVSKDGSSAFLIRLYASPMKPTDYIMGYTLPLIVLSLAQSLITFVFSIVIGCFTGYYFNLGNVVLCMITMLPTALLFVALGMFFGTVFSDKSAPPMSSIMISAASILGGMWMDIDSIGGNFLKISKVLPFYHGVKAARFAIQGEYAKIGKPVLIVIVYALAIFLLSALVFRRKMQKDVH